MVQAPFEEVFELARDPRRWAVLFQGVKDVVEVEKDRCQGMSVAKISVREGNERYTVSQVARLPGTIFRKMKRRGVATETTYHLSRAAEGTRVEFKTEISVAGIYRLLNPMAEWYLSKRLVEGNGFP